MSQLYELSRRFPRHLIKQPPKGKYGEYVEHSTYTERLLSIVGPFSTEVKQVFYNDKGQIDGIVLALTVTVDGRTVTVEEAGDCEQPDNWKTQGARLKDAVSDGMKRCCARLGLGLHLWSQDLYFLESQLAKAEAGAGATPAPAPTREASTAPAEPVSSEIDVSNWGKPGVCPSCGADVKDNRAEHEKDSKKPKWRCSNRSCQGGSEKKNGNGNWPWASWDSEPEEWGEEYATDEKILVEGFASAGQALSAAGLLDDDDPERPF